MAKILGVIQARGGSKGIPGKNIAPMAGHPLIAYTIVAGLESELVDTLLVSTDSEEIADVARAYGATVPFFRPAELSGDKVLSVDSLHWAVLKSEEESGSRYDFVVELPCVAPLRGPEDIDAALQKLMDTGADSVISMADTGEKHPIRLKKIVDDQIMDFTEEYPEPTGGSRRQDLHPTSYIRNGAIYSMTRSCLIDKYSRHGKDSRPFLMPPERSVNIDEPIDLRLVELMIREGHCPNRPVRASRGHPEKHHGEGSYKLLVTTNLSFIPEMKDEFARSSKETTFLDLPTREELRSNLPGVEAWVCSPSPMHFIGEDILSAAEDLKILVTPSTGTNHIDQEFCNSRGIEVRSLRGTDFLKSIHASSEFTFALLMAIMRRFPLAMERARQGFWRDAEDQMRSVELWGKTVGIIGFGRIGSNVGRYSNAFGMKVVAYEPFNTIEERYVDQLDSHWEVLQRADVVVISVHLDESTAGMVDASWFEMMKDGAYFVNTSRGEIVNEEALLEALSNGKLRAAGVDVITDELTSDKNTHPMIQHARAHENLVVTPHVAGLTRESELKAARQSLATIESFMQEEEG